VVLKFVFGFRGMPFLLMVLLDLDISSLSRVCDKPGFSGSFVVVIDVMKENGE
jgi:hypothetical protein